MKTAAKKKVTKKEPATDPMRLIRHDVNNQLSNIYLALEQLRYEIPDATADCVFYLDSIEMSAAKIHTLLTEEIGS
jgi:hypothetical protein